MKAGVVALSIVMLFIEMYIAITLVPEIKDKNKFKKALRCFYILPTLQLIASILVLFI